MALRLPTGATFLHVPKTGGTYVRKALQAAGVFSEPFKGKHEPIAWQDIQGPVFMVVRHPVALLRSYWLHMMTYGWSAEREFDDCQHTDLVAFLQRIAEEAPGAVGRLYSAFYDPVEAEACVGHTESLTADLVAFLDECGIDYNRDQLYLTPMANVAQMAPPELDHEHVDIIRQSEPETFELWGY